MTGEKPCNFALIGAGRMGERWAKVISESGKASLKVVIDIDLAQARKTAGLYNATFSKNYKDALKADVDAVAVVTPHKYLYSYARAALLAGKHVFVEKPGSRTTSEMRTLLNLAARKRLRLMIGFNYRSFDSIKRAKKIVDSGLIGKVSFVRIRHGHPGRPSYGKEWRMNKELAGGGVLMDQGLHVIDLANWFFGERAKKITGLMSNAFWKTKVEDNAFVLLKTPRGKIASLHVGITEWKPIFSFEIFGEKGYCFIPGLGRKYGDGKTLTVATYNHKYQTLREKKIVCDPDADKALREELREFIKSIQEKRKPSPNAGDALEVLKVIEAVYGKRH
jgi:predicted dehydrogenase